MPKVGMESIRRKQVIDGVLKCVAAEGLDRVTLDKAAKIAGVSKGVVSYYFKNKNNLLLQSFNAFLNSYLENANSYIASASATITAKEMLLIIGKVTLGQYPAKGELSNDENKKILLQIYSKLTISNEYKVMMKNSYDHFLEALTWILDYGIKTNEFILDDVKPTATRIMAMLDGLLIYSIIGFEGTGEEQFVLYKDFLERL